jgi:predicted lipoprotein with Yx(FWY)xxD motif
MFLQTRAARALVTIAGIAVTAAACGGSSSGGGTQTVNPGSGGSSSAAAAVTTHSGPDGAYLTDGKGRTLYIFDKDKGTTSTCSGDCAKEWPPFTTSGTPTATGSATGSMVATTDRSDGTTQVTYAGHPLYYFADDESTGDMKGQGENDFGGLWTAVTPEGAALTASQPSSSPSSSDGSSSGWG